MVTITMALLIIWEKISIKELKNKKDYKQETKKFSLISEVSTMTILTN